MGEHLYDADTCLSQNVYEIVCQIGASPENNEQLSLESSARNITNCLRINGIIDWDQLATFLPDYEDSAEYYKQCTRILSPLLHQIQFYYSHLTYRDFESTYNAHLSWISQKLVVLKCFELLECQSETAASHTLLLLTALIERGLGDLVCLKVKHCPSLLRDLLNVKELSHLLSPNIIQLLRILIGPPISLNLRNLVWHGFPSPSEIGSQFAYSMLCVLVSIGNHLLENELMATISFRQQFSVTLPQIFPDLSPSSLGLIQQAFHDSRLVLSSLRPLWMLSLELFVKNRYGECVVILMPQFEHAMRRVYVMANNCPQRLMTAENNALFTTFDEILNKYCSNSTENQFRNFVGDSYLILLLDFLVYPAGPRVRDHISHGEVVLSEVPQITAAHLIWLCYIIAIRFVPNYPVCTQNEFNQNIEKIVNEYTSLFHPLSVIKKKIFDLAQILSHWSSLPRLDASALKSDASVSLYKLNPTNTSFDQESHRNSDITLIHENPVMKAASVFERFLRSDGSKHQIDEALPNLHRILEPFSDCSMLVKERLDELRLNTIYRYQRTSFNRVFEDKCSSDEEELLGILSKILSALLCSSEQICNVLNIRFSQWKNRELRSRQRDTYIRMQNGFEEISNALRLILYITICLLSQLDDLNHDKSLTLIKFMKKIQKYSENLKTQTDINCNKWDKAFTQSLHLIEMTSAINVVQ